MNWTVVYLPSADSRLANIWLESDDRQSIADSANSLENQLQADPMNAGESRYANRRLIIEAPLALHFYCVPDDMKVVVYHVRLWK